MRVEVCLFLLLSVSGCVAASPDAEEFFDAGARADRQIVRSDASGTDASRNDGSQSIADANTAPDVPTCGAGGAVDCSSPLCVGDSRCHESACGDGLDNDTDGQSDCSDPDCANGPGCPELTCSDDIDNDGDGQADCSDDDCEPRDLCHETDCRDGVDNDEDGDTDCLDSECRLTGVCLS